jgi:hypothetical protein
VSRFAVYERPRCSRPSRNLDVHLVQAYAVAVVDLRRNRDLIREPRSLAQFMAARGWLRRFSKIKAVNRCGTSYGLKHVAEDDIGYVTNGCFIAAAIAEGFTVRCVEFGSPNASPHRSARPRSVCRHASVEMLNQARPAPSRWPSSWPSTTQ